MIDLARHIEVLLLTNDCVIVPGLGGFLAQHVSARRVEEENIFLPPSRTIGFNAQLCMNDGLLVQSYMEAYDDSFPEATRRVEDEVKELIEFLRKDGEYELRGIGTLSMNIEGVYTFTPNLAGALSPYLYGFSSFEIKKLSNSAESLDAEEKKESKAKSVFIQNTEQTTKTNEHKPVFSILNPNQDKNKTININLKVSWIRNAVAVAAAFLIFFLVTNKVENTYIDKSYYASNNQGKLFDAIKNKSLATTIVNFEQPSDTKSVNVVNKVATNNNEVKSTNETKTEKASNTPDVKENISNDKFCIVLASAVPKTSAQKFVKELKSEGFNNARVAENNNITRVVYGSYKSKEIALTELKKLRENKYFSDSWILKQN